MSETTVVLRAASAMDFDPVALANQHGVSLSRHWRLGTPKRPSGMNRSTGFNVSVAGGDPAGSVSAAVAFLRDHRSLLDALRQKDAALELDFGVLVGSEASFAPSLELHTELLALCVDTATALRVSCYPTED